MNDIAEDEITGYVAEVRLALGGLPEATREELLDDLPEHLAEVLAEGNGTLVERLGAPSAYAAELLAAAGLATESPKDMSPWVRPDEVRERVLRWLRAVDVRVGPVLGYERASEFLVLLRPAWWVLRGYLVAMVLAHLLDGGSGPVGLLPRIGDSVLVALALLAGCVVASIWFGRRELPDKPWPRYALWSGTAVLVLLALAGFAGADSSSRSTPYMDATYSGGSPYDSVQDVFVYDSQGRLVEDALLYDQNGAPLRLGSQYCVDQRTGDSWTSWQRGYPHCPQVNPFRSPPPSPTDDVTPSPDSSVPASAAVPAASASERPAGGAVSPSASVSAPAPARSSAPSPSASPSR
ncbi:HAAS signaling domain-containing protein [Actinoplanes regularis]|uniref:Uncharacterized membrane protein n=1 Tax=Actinoplanes regularis TaxID=52697 RepID=A0A238ZN50_9ACTN|nr:hypothetical protein [Actinoplanes regularis]GIE87607.1 hypothetical protein Are01nite_40870 [Actinoplanes regularis]SNR84093.1 Uncharacterized membrane protein [Actinoplanes regularis]